MKLEQIDPLIYLFLFLFFGLRKNLSIFPIQSSCSIGINCHFVPSRRTIYSKSQDKNSLSFFDYSIKINLSLYNIIFLFTIRSRLDVPKISISLHPIFLFRQSYEEWMRDKYSHFQSPISFIEYCYCIKSKKLETIYFLTKKKKYKKLSNLVYIKMRIEREFFFLISRTRFKNPFSWWKKMGAGLRINR